ncbi:hypothetical protein KW782_00005 [Candidatus Parcubacteria bacterium]|nr:hypothetical protein [Candidatus Parcubacteria bacterium]
MPKSEFNIVDLLILQAKNEGASELHIVPEKTFLAIIFKIQNISHEKYILGKHMYSEITDMMTLVSQDGRVSVIPTPHGDKIILSFSHTAQIDNEEF